jgi:hypothetical protein
MGPRGFRIPPGTPAPSPPSRDQAPAESHEAPKEQLARGPVAVAAAAGAGATQHAGQIETPRTEDRPPIRRLASIARDAAAQRAGGSRDGCSGPDRRLSFRYPVDSLEVQIAWSAVAARDSTRSEAMGQRSLGKSSAERGDGDGPPVPNSLVRHTAQVVDLSQMGLSLLADHPPPSDRQLWIGILENGLLSWSEVNLRSLSHLAPDVHLLRLSFQETCPYELFKAAVLRHGTRPAGAGSTGSSASPEARA